MDKIIRNRILSLPFGAELSLKIPESSVNSLIRDCLDLSYIEEPSMVFHAGYFTFKGNISMIVTSVKLHLDLEVQDILFDGEHLVLELRDHGDTLLSVAKIISFLGSMFSKIISVEGKVIRIDLSARIAKFLENQHPPMQNIIQSIRIEKPEFTEGSMKITFKRETAL